MCRRVVWDGERVGDQQKAWQKGPTFTTVCCVLGGGRAGLPTAAPQAPPPPHSIASAIIAVANTLRGGMPEIIKNDALETSPYVKLRY